MTKAFLVAMIVLAIAAVGVAYYKINIDMISVEDEAQKITPAALNNSITPKATETKADNTKPETKAGDTTAGEKCLTMDYTEAKKLAEESECGKTGDLVNTHFCNEGTKTWWIDMVAEDPKCNPACVINVETKQAEINWRCTGAMPIPAGDQGGGEALPDVPQQIVPATEITPASN